MDHFPEHFPGEFFRNHGPFFRRVFRNIMYFPEHFPEPLSISGAFSGTWNISPEHSSGTMVPFPGAFSGTWTISPEHLFLINSENAFKCIMVNGREWQWMAVNGRERPWMTVNGPEWQRMAVDAVNGSERF